MSNARGSCFSENLFFLPQTPKKGASKETGVVLVGDVNANLVQDV